MAIEDCLPCDTVSPTRSSELDLSADESSNCGVDSRELLRSLDSSSNQSSCTVECVDVCSPCNDRSLKIDKKRKSICCNPISQCVWGCLFVVVSIGTFIFTPLDLVLFEKLNMRPGLPPFEWWSDPPDEVKTRVYVFNVTNHERFLNGLDDKINVVELQPIIYLEKLKHFDMEFHQNGTLTYTARRIPIFLPNENSVDLNATIIVPNFPLLGMASYLYNAPYFIRTGFKLLAKSKRSEFFVKLSIYEFLWEFREPMLDVGKSLLPGIVPLNNMGVLATIYNDFTDRVTVFVGPGWGHKKFFQIDKFRGQSQLPGFDYDTCPDRLYGSTEGVMYHQRLSKSDVLLYWRKTVCKIMPLYYDNEIISDGITLYRYNLSETVHDRKKNGTDCYEMSPPLQSGLSDGSKCFFNFPLVVSYPHFYIGSPLKDKYVTGLTPDRYKHNSYVIVEPLTGIPFHSVARMQSNVLVHDLSGFSSDYNRFSNLILPMCWIEYSQESLPGYMRYTLYFIVVVLPPLGVVLSTIGLIAGAFLILKPLYYRRFHDESLSALLPFKKNVALANNALFSYESDSFIKKPR